LDNATKKTAKFKRGIDLRKNAYMTLSAGGPRESLSELAEGDTWNIEADEINPAQIAAQSLSQVERWDNPIFSSSSATVHQISRWKKPLSTSPFNLFQNTEIKPHRLPRLYGLLMF